jgi:hypothetical protein
MLDNFMDVILFHFIFYSGAIAEEQERKKPRRTKGLYLSFSIRLFFKKQITRKDFSSLREFSV